MKEDDDDGGSLEDRGVFLFSGEVDDALCEDTIRWILNENFENRHEQLTLIVNSPGGYVTSGFSVIDVMVGSRIPVRTVGLGMIASMGLLIFIAGQKGERTLTPNTLVMSHQFSGFREGKEHELIASAKKDGLVSEMIIKHYKKHTGLSLNKIKKYLLPASDVYLTAAESLELNLCDKIKLNFNK